MNRRNFLYNLSMMAPAAAYAQTQRPRENPVERFTAGAFPAIALSHVGFVPGAPKVLVYRVPAGSPRPRSSACATSGQPPKPFRFTRPLKKYEGDLGECVTGDFSDLERQALYQITAGEERSVPFFVRSDLWRRTLPKAVDYYRQQRCGVAVPGVHAACHLDDARRRDTGEYIDVTGGWHDAGDLRKWMFHTLINGFGLGNLARNLGETWDVNGSGLKPLLDELRWGNRYFLKMQDRDGLVFHSSAGGLNGGESDNHWTDNIIGNEDDRYIDTRKEAGHPGHVHGAAGPCRAGVQGFRSGLRASLSSRRACVAGTLRSRAAIRTS